MGGTRTLMIALLQLTVAVGAGDSGSGVRELRASDELLRLLSPEHLEGQSSPTPLLLLCHASPVNSPESKAAIDTFNKVATVMEGLASLATLDCDVFVAECSFLQVLHYPQVILSEGGERFLYTGPLTGKGISLFASNAISRKVAILKSNLTPQVKESEASLAPYHQVLTSTGKAAGSLQWWLSDELNGKTPVIFFPQDADTRLPVAVLALANELSSSHAFAALISVPDAIKERFKLKADSLPALATGPSEGPYRIYTGEFKRSLLKKFIVGRDHGQADRSRDSFQPPTSKPSASSASRQESETKELLDKLSPAETYGLEHLTISSQEKLCANTCSVILIPKESSSEALKERRKRMNLMRDLIKAMGSNIKSPNFPKLVWASRAQQGVVCELEGCGDKRGLSDGQEVSLLVWKVKRNRVTWLAKPLTVNSAKAFLEAVLGGDAQFKPLTGTPRQLLAIPGIDPEASSESPAPEAGQEAQHVPPGFVHWAYPVNTIKEKQGVSRPAVSSDDSGQSDESDDGIVL